LVRVRGAVSAPDCAVRHPQARRALRRVDDPDRVYATGGQAPYEDEVDYEGNLCYKWRGTDPGHSDNRALREAMRRGAPLAYFYPIARGVYHAIYPVYLVEEDTTRHEFAVVLNEKTASPISVNMI